jgi:hypothetical protein
MTKGAAQRLIGIEFIFHRYAGPRLRRPIAEHRMLLWLISSLSKSKTSNVA